MAGKLVGKVRNAHTPGDLWHLSIDDLLKPPGGEDAPQPAGPGPFVLNLSTSTAPIPPPPPRMPRFEGLRTYQLQRAQDGRRRVQFVLRLGIIRSSLEADAILASVREHYPGATLEVVTDEDQEAVAAADAAEGAKQKPASRIEPPPPAPKQAAARGGAGSANSKRSEAASESASADSREEPTVKMPASVLPDVPPEPVGNIRWDIDELLPDLPVTRASQAAKPVTPPNDSSRAARGGSGRRGASATARGTARPNAAQQSPPSSRGSSAHASPQSSPASRAASPPPSNSRATQPTPRHATPSRSAPPVAHRTSAKAAKKPSRDSLEATLDISATTAEITVEISLPALELTQEIAPLEISAPMPTQAPQATAPATTSNPPPLRAEIETAPSAELELDFARALNEPEARVVEVTPAAPPPVESAQHEIPSPDIEVTRDAAVEAQSGSASDASNAADAALAEMLLAGAETSASAPIASEQTLVHADISDLAPAGPALESTPAEAAAPAPAVSDFASALAESAGADESLAAAEAEIDALLSAPIDIARMPLVPLAAEPATAHAEPVAEQELREIAPTLAPIEAALTESPAEAAIAPDPVALIDAAMPPDAAVQIDDRAAGPEVVETPTAEPAPEPEIEHEDDSDPNADTVEVEALVMIDAPLDDSTDEAADAPAEPVSQTVTAAPATSEPEMVFELEYLDPSVLEATPQLVEPSAVEIASALETPTESALLPLAAAEEMSAVSLADALAVEAEASVAAQAPQAAEPSVEEGRALGAVAELDTLPVAQPVAEASVADAASMDAAPVAMALAPAESEAPVESSAASEAVLAPESVATPEQETLAPIATSPSAVEELDDGSVTIEAPVFWNDTTPAAEVVADHPYPPLGPDSLTYEVPRFSTDTSTAWRDTPIAAQSEPTTERQIGPDSMTIEAPAFWRDTRDAEESAPIVRALLEPGADSPTEAHEMAALAARVAEQLADAPPAEMLAATITEPETLLTLMPEAEAAPTSDDAPMPDDATSSSESPPSPPAQLQLEESPDSPPASDTKAEAGAAPAPAPAPAPQNADRKADSQTLEVFVAKIEALIDTAEANEKPAEAADSALAGPTFELELVPEEYPAAPSAPATAATPAAKATASAAPPPVTRASPKGTPSGSMWPALTLSSTEPSRSNSSQEKSRHEKSSQATPTHRKSTHKPTRRAHDVKVMPSSAAHRSNSTATPPPPPAQAAPPVPSGEPQLMSEELPAFDSTQTIRALTTLELQDGQASKSFAIQLLVSEEPILPEQIPNLDIFEAYRLYVVTGLVEQGVRHALRLGFFTSEVAAEAVAGYLKSYFEKPDIKRVSLAEHDRFQDRRVAARKDIGATGTHKSIELTSRPPLPERRAKVEVAAAKQTTPSLWSRLLKR